MVGRGCFSLADGLPLNDVRGRQRNKQASVHITVHNCNPKLIFALHSSSMPRCRSREPRKAAVIAAFIPYGLRLPLRLSSSIVIPAQAGIHIR